MPKPFERERRRRAKERREQYEFSTGVKLLVFTKAGGYCQECRVRRGTEYHHLISIEQAINFEYDPAKINCVENCLLVCDTCHHKLDN